MHKNVFKTNTACQPLDSSRRPGTSLAEGPRLDVAGATAPVAAASRAAAAAGGGRAVTQGSPLRGARGPRRPGRWSPGRDRFLRC